MNQKSAQESELKHLVAGSLRELRHNCKYTSHAHFQKAKAYEKFSWYYEISFRCADGVLLVCATQFPKLPKIPAVFIFSSIASVIVKTFAEKDRLKEISMESKKWGQNWLDLYDRSTELRDSIIQNPKMALDEYNRKFRELLFIKSVYGNSAPPTDDKYYTEAKEELNNVFEQADISYEEKVFK